VAQNAGAGTRGQARRRGTGATGMSLPTGGASRLATPAPLAGPSPLAAPPAVPTTDFSALGPAQSASIQGLMELFGRIRSNRGGFGGNGGSKG
jgi:hypothetical protein